MIETTLGPCLAPKGQGFAYFLNISPMDVLIIWVNKITYSGQGRIFLNIPPPLSNTKLSSPPLSLSFEIFAPLHIICLPSLLVFKMTNFMHKIWGRK